MELGFHFSHEQFSPRFLLDLVPRTEEAGFKHALCSDHFHPWGEEQGHSGFAWSWLGAAMERSSLTFGTVNAPGQRYHPAIIAQAAATLAEMFPNRFWVAFGSGQLLNEGVTGTTWPAKELRNKRLKESVNIIRRLLNGETVTEYGIITIEEAQIYSLPPSPPPLFGAALTAKTAGWVQEWADGLLTASKPVEELKNVVNSFREKSKDKPIYLKYQISYSPDKDKALKEGLKQWKGNVISPSVQANLRTPAQYDETAESVSEDFFTEQVLVTDKADDILEQLHQFKQLGFSRTILHNVNPMQEDFLDLCKKTIIPEFSEVK
jgi:coenzyme F420-dependent glucose-6-phosphate dehydrogenase